MSEDTVPKKSDDSDLNIDFTKINIRKNPKTNFWKMNVFMIKGCLD